MPRDQGRRAAGRSRAQSRAADIAGRVAAAALGGYGVTCAATICLAAILPLRRAEAVLAASMLSFTVYVAAVVWAFAAASPRRAWIGLLAAGAICLLISAPAMWR